MKNDEFARDLRKIEYLVADHGVPVNEAMQKVSAITGWKENGRDYKDEYRYLLECMQDYIKATPAPAKNTVLITGGTPKQRSRVAEMFVNLFAADWVIPADRAFTIKAGGAFSDYVGQPCVWFDEMTTADLLRSVRGYDGFLRMFEPWPHHAVSIGDAKKAVCVNNALNLVTTAEDPHELVDAINASRVKSGESCNADEAFRRLPIWFVIANDGSARICINDEIIPHADGNYADYVDLYSLTAESVRSDDLLSAVVGNTADTCFFRGAK